MSRYIDADALIKDIESRRLVFKDTITVAEALLSQGNAIRKAIDEAPTADVVEVVRCRDCKYHHNLEGGVKCERLDGLLMTLPNDYCSYGKRSENGT